MPFLVLYKELALLDTRIGLILVYTLMVLPIVIWVMRDQFDTIPTEMEQAALVDGCTIWGAFLRIVVPIALPGMVAAFILSLVLCWNEYFFASLLTGFDAQTLPVMVASQTGSSGINWWTIAALATAAITPLLLIGIFLERYIVMGLTAGSGQIARGALQCPTPGSVRVSASGRSRWTTDADPRASAGTKAVCAGVSLTKWRVWVCHGDRSARQFDRHREGDPTGRA